MALRPITLCFYRREANLASLAVWLYQKICRDRHADITHVGLRLSGGEMIDMRLGVCYIGMPITEKQPDYELVIATPLSDYDLVHNALDYHYRYGTMSLFNFRRTNCVSLVRHTLEIPDSIYTPAELYRYASRRCQTLLRQTCYRIGDVDTPSGYVTLDEWFEDERRKQRSN